LKKAEYPHLKAMADAPPGLKAIQAYLKIAIDHDQRDFIGKNH
jgi:hypothetical protein